MQIGKLKITFYLGHIDNSTTLEGSENIILGLCLMVCERMILLAITWVK